MDVLCTVSVLVLPWLLWTPVNADGGSVHRLERGYRDCASTHCRLSRNGSQQLVLFGLTLDGAQVDVLPLNKNKQPTIRSTVTLPLAGKYLTVSRSCGVVAISHEGALSTFDPTESQSQLLTHEAEGLTGKFVATEKGYAVGFVTSSKQLTSKSFVTCLNLKNGTVTTCGNCGILYSGTKSDTKLAVLAGADTMYAYNSSHIIKADLGAECLHQRYIRESAAFGTTEVFSVGAGAVVVTSRGNVYSVSGDETSDLAPRGSVTSTEACHAHRDTVLSYLVQRGHRGDVFTGTADCTNISRVSWPYLYEVGWVEVPPLVVAGVTTDTATPEALIHIVQDDQDEGLGLYAVARYTFDGGPKVYGLSYLPDVIMPAPNLSHGMHHKINEVQSMHLFRPDDYDDVVMCPITDIKDDTGSDPHMLAYKDNIVVFLNVDFSWKHPPINLPLPVMRLSFDTNCQKVVFLHKYYISVMVLHDASFYTVPTDVAVSTSLLLMNDDSILLFPESGQECAILSLDLSTNETRSCDCDGTVITQAFSSVGGITFYTLSPRAHGQTLSKYHADVSQCPVPVAAVVTSDPLAQIVWLHPDGRSLALSSGLVVDTGNLTSLGYLSDDSSPGSSRYFAFASKMTGIDVVASAVDGQQYLTVFLWPELQALSYIYVSPPVCGRVQAQGLMWSAVQGRALMAADVTMQDGGKWRALAWVELTAGRRLSAVLDWYSEGEMACAMGYTTNPSRGPVAEITSPFPWWLGPEWFSSSPNRDGSNPLVNSSMSSSDPGGGLFRWGYVVGVLGGCVLAVCVVVGVGLGLGLVLCRRPPQSVMTTPLIDSDSVQQASREQGSEQSQLYQGQPNNDISERGRHSTHSPAQVFFQKPQGAVYVTTGGGRQVTSYGTPHSQNQVPQVAFKTCSDSGKVIASSGKVKEPSVPSRDPQSGGSDAALSLLDNVQVSGGDGDVSMTIVRNTSGYEGVSLDAAALNDNVKGDTLI